MKKKLFFLILGILMTFKAMSYPTVQLIDISNGGSGVITGGINTWYGDSTAFINLLSGGKNNNPIKVVSASYATDKTKVQIDYYDKNGVNITKDQYTTLYGAKLSNFQYLTYFINGISYNALIGFTFLGCNAKANDEPEKPYIKIYFIPNPIYQASDTLKSYNYGFKKNFLDTAKAYNDGFNKGKLSVDTTKAYNDGYSIGHDLGYKNGYNKGKLSVVCPDTTKAYNDGYNKGLIACKKTSTKSATLNDVSLYPNPTYKGDKVNISYNGTFSNVSVYDLNGRLELTDIVPYFTTETLNTGIHIVKITTNDEISNFKLIVK